MKKIILTLLLACAIIPHANSMKRLEREVRQQLQFFIELNCQVQDDQESAEFLHIQRLRLKKLYEKAHVEKRMGDRKCYLETKKMICILLQEIKRFLENIQITETPYLFTF